MMAYRNFHRLGYSREHQAQVNSCDFTVKSKVLFLPRRTSTGLPGFSLSTILSSPLRQWVVQTAEGVFVLGVHVPLSAGEGTGRIVEV